MRLRFADEGDSLNVRSLIALDSFARDPNQELATRPNARAWWIVAILLALTIWIVVWTRRSEVGLYRAIGTSASQLGVLGAVERHSPSPRRTSRHSMGNSSLGVFTRSLSNR